jgi:hypothetical protein
MPRKPAKHASPTHHLGKHGRLNENVVMNKKIIMITIVAATAILITWGIINEYFHVAFGSPGSMIYGGFFTWSSGQVFEAAIYLLFFMVVGAVIIIVYLGLKKSPCST